MMAGWAGMVRRGICQLETVAIDVVRPWTLAMYIHLMFGPRQLFRDPAVPLTPAQERSARSAARRAARESRSSLRTARGQYRRYRDGAGDNYLDWPRWRAEYLKEYRGGYINQGGLSTGTDTTGAAGGLYF
jgi:hypothetical protein